VLYPPPPPPVVCRLLLYLILLGFIVPVIFREGHKLRRYRLCCFLYLLSFLLAYLHIWSVLFPDCLFPLGWETEFHTHAKQHVKSKFCTFYFLSVKARAKYSELNSSSDPLWSIISVDLFHDVWILNRIRVKMSIVFWDFALYSLVEVCRRFRSASYLHRQGWLMQLMLRPKAHLKRRWTSTRLYGATSQKRVTFILAAAISWNLTWICVIFIRLKVQTDLRTSGLIKPSRNPFSYETSALRTVSVVVWRGDTNYVLHETHTAKNIKSGTFVGTLLCGHQS
jgi:hypothetical protein